MGTAMLSKAATLVDDNKRTEQVTVNRVGRQINIPEGMSIPDAIKALQRRYQQDEQEMTVHHRIEGFPLDGAVAFQKALDQIYGWTDAVTTPGGMFRPPQPPTLVSVPIGPNQTTQVVWGRLVVPKIEGYLVTSLDPDNPAFIIGGQVKSKHRAEIDLLAAKTREILQEESIYKGRAITVDWTWKREGEDFSPEAHAPRFIDLSGIKEDELIFGETTQQGIDAGIFIPVEYKDACRQAKVPLKRGVLLEGPWGVGKSLCASVTAVKGTRNGWTYIYVQDVRDLASAVAFAHAYQPAIVFAEDVDRTINGERSIEMDSVLNIVDGIKSKGTEMMLILTTNNISAINQALLRPGRLDSVITVSPPNAEAAARLIRLYGRNMLADDVDVDEIGELLDGQIAAVIREVVERAKIASIRHANGMQDGSVTTADLRTATVAMKQHMDLLKPKEEDKRDGPTKIADSLLAVAESLKVFGQS